MEGTDGYLKGATRPSAGQGEPHRRRAAYACRDELVELREAVVFVCARAS